MSENIKLGVYDVLTELKDAGAITESAAGTVDDLAKVFDLGSATRLDAKAIVNVSAADVAAGAKQVITIQVSDDSFVADIYNVGILELGDGASLVGDTDVGAGQYEIPFNNVINGTAKRYVRIYATITEKSPVSSLNYTAHLVPTE